MNFKAGPVKKPMPFQKPNEVVKALPTPEALPAVPNSPAKRFTGIQKMLKR